MREKIALSVNESLCITALDFAPMFVIADVNCQGVKNRRSIQSNESLPSLRANKLNMLEITIVLCGAISDSLSLLLWHYGITVIAGLSGNADTLLDAYTTGEIDQFHTPDFHPGFRGGCRFRNRRRWRGGNNL